MASSKRPAVMGSLSSRKPNLHLSFDKTSQPNSRFSTFSSNEGTPSNEFNQRSKGVKDSPNISSRAGYSSSTFNRSNSSLHTPATETPYISGLGIGLPGSMMPSPRALSDLASSSNSLSSMLGGGSSSAAGYDQLSASQPQTPNRSRMTSTDLTPSTMVDSATSPLTSYDRTGQIGIGELSTPRWATNAASTSQNNHQDWVGGDNRHARAISFSVTAPPPPPDYTKGERLPVFAAALPSPRKTFNSMVASPSLPSFGPSLGGFNSLASLKQQYEDKDGMEDTTGHPYGKSTAALRRDLDTPDYSINALSESEDDVASDALPSTQQTDTARSPRIGDSAWSEQETGPFAVASTIPSSDPARVLGEEQKGQERSTISNATKESGGQLSTSGKNAEGNIEVASSEEAKRRVRRSEGAEKGSGRGMAGDVVGGKVTSASSLVAMRRSGLESSRVDSTSTQPDDKKEVLDVRATQDGIHGSRRSRRVSSPSLTLTKANSMARLPSSSSAQSLASNIYKKRSSSASIGHSLLRGNLPFGASEEYEGMLSGENDAAEALKKLDGIGSTSRNSMIRDRELSKSPRSSKQSSRPSSVGRRTPGNASRTSSPSSKHRESMSGSRHQKEDSAAPKSSSSSSRRTSRSMNKAKSGEDISTSSFVAETTDGHKRISISSPRIKRTVLPPLPTQNNANVGLSGLNSPKVSNNVLSTGNGSREATHRTSAASTYSPSISFNRPLSGSNLGKSKQTGDTLPSQDSPGFTTGVLGLATSSDEVTNHLTSMPSGNLFVPPVPPLPKGWDGTRTASMQSTDTTNNSSSQESPKVLSTNTSTVSFVNQRNHSIESNPPVSQPPLTKKWSLTNLGGVLTSKKSEERLSTRKSMLFTQASQQQSTADGLVATAEDDRGIAERRRSATKLSATGAEMGRKMPPKGLTNFPPTSFPSNRMEQANASTLSLPPDGAMAPTPAAAATSSVDLSLPAKSPSLTTTSSSPKSRRTPSFFRKLSREASVDDDLSSLRPSQEQQKGSFTSQESNEKTRTETLTPSGRSSRKSILAIGNLLRSASKRNVESMPTNARVSGKREKSVDEGVGDDSVSTQDSASQAATPKFPSLSNMRRSSMMGRKRGKTLPSSNDPPKAQATNLPPLQVASIPVSPVYATNTSSERVTDATGNIRYANPTPNGESASTPLGYHSSDPLNNVTPGNYISSLSAIAASPPDNVAERRTDHELSDGHGSPTKRGGLAANADNGHSASRIPRATTVGSIKRLTLTGSQNSHTPFKRLISHPASSLPTSKTSTTLASNLGFSHGSDSDQASIETTRKTSGQHEQSQQQEQQDIAASPSVGSATLVSILNAYTNAKTPAEVEVVLRRAKLASHSTILSAREREVLVSLVLRQDQKKQSEAGVETSSASNDLHSTPSSTSRLTKPVGEGSQNHRLNSALSSSSNGHIPTATQSVPRKARVSMTAALSSNANRAVAKEASLSSSASKMNYNRTSIAASPNHFQAPITPSTRSTATNGAATTHSTTPSPLLYDEEREGDEEMEAYIRRRHNKKIAQGAKISDLERMLQFPEDEEASKCYSYRQAEAIWGDKLTDLELTEMKSFKEIYFVGQQVDKRARSLGEDASTNNLGYDDERGDYLVLNHDHLAYRYEVTGLLGRGSFGQVLQCKDHKTGRSVAIKLIRNKKRFHHQALVEVKILENLVKWDPNEEFNVIRVLDNFYFRNHLCISMELLSINLYELIKANSFVGFSTKLIRRLTSQVLASLTLLRKNRVVHCDLKPENILLMHPRKSAIRVIDFGSSCFEHEKVYTYIQSRFYRSPEVILGMNYHTAIDIWSLGCIIAELYTGYPLFPGENEQEQLACIMEVLGIPDRYVVEKSSRKKLFFDSTGAPRPVVNSKGKRRRPNAKTLSSALNCNDELFLDFLSKCLHWDPERRIKPEMALRHPWIKRTADGHHRPSGSSYLAPSASSHTLQNPSTTSSRRAMFTSMTSSSSPAASSVATATAAATTTTNLAKSVGATKSTTTTTTATTNPNHAQQYRAGITTTYNGNKITAPTHSTSSSSSDTPIRHERRISLRNNHAANGTSTSTAPLKTTRNQQTVS
ncbi:hypothetical protein CBS101457_005950 [Exobasidium rhododendri]|nr:hypothetical protein CBS101457_005950 [Exobasidium rhododendri]